jgi:hypothetical protein
MATYPPAPKPKPILEQLRDMLEQYKNDCEGIWQSSDSGYICNRMREQQKEIDAMLAKLKPDDDNTPDNELERPILDLVERLLALPPGTTYKEEEPLFYGGQTIMEGKTLGTGYQLRIDIVEGIN